MILIAAVDDSRGLLFNRRRQSQDRVLRERILAMTAGGTLRMSPYSAQQFADCAAPQLAVSEDFLAAALPGDFCFVEDASVAACADRVERLVLFKWNRRYPGDFFFDLDDQGWRLTETEDFPGSSHENITMEVYEHG